MVFRAVRSMVAFDRKSASVRKDKTARLRVSLLLTSLSIFLAGAIFLRISLGRYLIDTLYPLRDAVVRNMASLGWPCISSVISNNLDRISLFASREIISSP